MTKHVNTEKAFSIAAAVATVLDIKVTDSTGSKRNHIDAE